MIQMPTGGTVYSMMRMQKLQMKWDMRQKNPNMPKGETEDKKIVQLRKDAEQVRRSNIIASIDGKLKAGGKLSTEELDYLRENCPQLYKEAMEVAMEREQYRKALEKCQTKEDVERLNSNKMQNFLSQAKTISSNPNISVARKQELLDKVLRRLMGVKSEHLTFTKTPQYANLPREAELEDEKAKKKKQAVAEIEQDEQPDKPHLDNGAEEPAKPQDPEEAEEPPPAADKPSKPSQDGSTTTDKKRSSSAKSAGGVHKPAAPTEAYTATATTGHTPAPKPAKAARPTAISLRA